ncbi:MAG: lipase family protein [Bacteroidota bacterium]
MFKRSLLCLLLMGCLSLFTQAQLTSYELVDSYSIPELQQLGDNLGISPILMDYDYAVDFYVVRYQTPNPQGQMVTASGALMVPVGNTCQLPMASYQHGSISEKDDVPSRASGESDVGLLYGTNGFFVAMPDYVGLGDSPGLHPYVHEATEASAVIDMIRASKAVIAELGNPLSDQLFLFGYSQGGHATVAAHKVIQEELSNELVVTASNPMSGPYDLSGIQANVIIQDEPYPSPSYLPYVELAYQDIYGTLYNDPSDVFISPYDTLLPPLFDGSLGLGEINAMLPAIPKAILQDSVVENFINNPNHPFKVALEDNDLYDWMPTSPIRLTYCMGDDQISFENSLLAQTTFVQNGAMDIEVSDLGDDDHAGCASPALINGLFYFKGFRTEFNGIDVLSQNISGETAIGASDGFIELVVTGGVGGLQFEWSNGFDSPDLPGVPGGTYDLTITDDAGCSITRRFEVPSPPVGVFEFEKHESLALFPNPSSQWIAYQLPKGQLLDQVRIWNVLGQEQSVQSLQQQQLDISHLHPGIYWLSGRVGEQWYYGKFMVD